MGILTPCLNIFPVILLFFGVLGMLGYVQTGPREVPKSHRYNRRFAGTFLPLALGIYLLGSQTQSLFVAGAVISIAALVLYGYFYREARKEFPEMSPQQWLETLSSRNKGNQNTTPPDSRKKLKK